MCLKHISTGGLTRPSLEIVRFLLGHECVCVIWTYVSSALYPPLFLWMTYFFSVDFNDIKCVWKGLCQCQGVDGVDLQDFAALKGLSFKLSLAPHSLLTAIGCLHVCLTPTGQTQTQDGAVSLVMSPQVSI